MHPCGNLWLIIEQRLSPTSVHMFATACDVYLEDETMPRLTVPSV